MISERMSFRFYRPEDKEAVIAIFKRQGLKVHLPLPEDDAATAIGVVGEEDGEVKLAFFLRSTYELHLVAAPDEPNLAFKLRRLGAITEGAAMELGVELAKVKFAVPNDVIAFVPKGMSGMVDYMKRHLGFIDEATDEFDFVVKRLGS